MATLEALYLQDPFWIWLATACLFVALNLATGAQLLMWPAMAAVLVAVLELVGLKAGIGIEVVLFAALSAGALWTVHMRTAARPMVAAGVPEMVERQERGAAGRQDQTGRLIGRIGRTTSEFVNGVGRVWIDGAEWGAELETGEDVLPEGAPVRVVKVIGGIRLKVHALTTG